MPDVTPDGTADVTADVTEGSAEVEQEKQDQVLKREGVEEELMQQDRSTEAETIAAVETGEENL